MTKIIHTEKDKISISVVLALIVIAGLLAAAFLLKSPVGVFTPEMLRTICVIATALVLWTTQALPPAVSSLFLLVLLPWLGLADDLADAFSGFTNATNYFIIASFGIAIAVKKTSVSNTILRKLLALARGRTDRVILAFMSTVYVLSCVMSDIPAVIIGIAFARQLLDVLDENEQQVIGKPLMLCIPFGSIIGGTSTPAGSSVNVMALNILHANTGMDISFLQWCVVCLPVSLLLLLAGWQIIVRLFRVRGHATESLEAFMDSMSAEDESASGKDGYVVAVLFLMIAAWIGGTWISALNMTTVAIFGLFLLVFPGIGVFNWKEFASEMPWEIFLMGGATIQFGSLARKTGLVQLLADALQARFNGISAAGMVVLLGLLVTAILVIMPVGPAAVSMLVMPTYTLSAAMGVNPGMAIITLGAFCSNCCILPLNSVMLLSFGTGRWKIPDLIKTGLLITLAWVILGTLWYPFAASLVLR